MSAGLFRVIAAAYIGIAVYTILRVEIGQRWKNEDSMAPGMLSVHIAVAVTACVWLLLNGM